MAAVNEDYKNAYQNLLRVENAIALELFIGI